MATTGVCELCSLLVLVNIYIYIMDDAYQVVVNTTTHETVLQSTKPEPSMLKLVEEIFAVLSSIVLFIST